MNGELLYIKASNPDAQDWFGGSLALDGSWLAVGARGESSRATGLNGEQADDSEDESGAVYLLSDDGAGWAQRAYVKASNTEAGNGFGYVLSLSGDRLAAGAPFEDGDGTGVNGNESDGVGNAGAVYVFVRSGATWNQEAYIKASNTGVVDLFGTSLELEGDTLVVGAPWEDSAATDVDGEQGDDSAEHSGAVYVFERAKNGWSQTAYVKASYSEAGDELGRAVALSGDTLAVGAPGESSSTGGVNPEPMDDGASNSGAVYLFERGGTSFVQADFLKASNADADDEFGAYLALDGDSLAVGAPGEATMNGDGTQSNELLPDCGAVYVFERSDGTWLQTAYLKPADPSTEYFFGTALALSGDTLVVGALADSAASRAGAAYIFKRAPGGWTLAERRAAPNAQINDRFGSAVAVTPTLLAIGADGEASDSPGIGGDGTNNRTPFAGAVYLYMQR